MDQITFDFLKAAWTVFGIAGPTVVVTLVGGFFAFRYLSTKWLDGKFEERMAAFKHEQAKEIEKHKHTINKLFDRAVRVHQNEFEAVPEVWRRLIEAFYRTQYMIGGLKYSFDLSNKTDEQIRQLAEAHGFTKIQVTDIMESEDRQSAFRTMDAYKELQQTDEKIIAYRLYLEQYGIFIRPELESLFAQLQTLISKAYTEHEITVRHGNQGFGNKSRTALREQGPPLLDELKAKVQGRLWSAADSPDD